MLYEEYKEWQNKFSKVITGELKKKWDRFFNPPDIKEIRKKIPYFDPDKKIATRSASGKILETLFTELPNIVGGSADLAMKLAKKALLMPLDKENEDKQLAELEKELYKKLNSLGVGPMGMGGGTTVLGVRIKYAYCHTASLPVAINFHCWAARHKRARIYTDRVEYL